MARVFNVTCPKCGKVFQAHYQDLRHKNIKLKCPYCHTEFKEEESPHIEE